MSSQKTSLSQLLNSNVWHASLLALVVALAIYRFVLVDPSDRYRCSALLESGQWLDQKHSNWQPDGCMLHSYSPPQVATCLSGRRVVFIGDSTVRQVFYAAVKHVDPTVDTRAEKHSDRSLVARGIGFDFVWDPFLNGTTTERILEGRRGVIGMGDEDMPTLLVLGTGVWYLRHPESGGIPAWSTTVNDVFSAMRKDASIADQVVLLPVVEAIEDKLSEERRATMHHSDIDAMNADLQARLSSTEVPAALSIPTVFNQLIARGIGASETLDGLHFSDAISQKQASILYNLRCNDVMPKKFPLEKTCCYQYPFPNFVQVMLLLILLGIAPLSAYLANSNKSASLRRFLPPPETHKPLAIFGCAVVFMFLGDRTHVFPKEQKQFDVLQFVGLCLLTVAAGVGTMKAPEKDLGFLNRDQTDEWKGWMQIAILIYHYYGASKVSAIYNPIRVLVAAYLWMSGYGHFTYYYKKADFGFARVANVLVRLNLLTVVLAYVMDTDYLSYYFSPLVSMWFGIIWAIMYIGHQWNSSSWFICGKIAMAAAVTTAFFELGWPLKAAFSFLNTVFRTDWNATEWAFRVTLDMWIVFGGMYAAFAFIKFRELRIAEQPWFPRLKAGALILASIAMFAFTIFELKHDKITYNKFHPYLSTIPVLAFIVLRNATPYLRSTSSKFFIFFGKCSLETFICQFHIFLAADTKGIIMMIPGTPFRIINFAITSLVFVYISNEVASATGDLTTWICSDPNKQLPGPATRRPDTNGVAAPQGQPAQEYSDGDVKAQAAVASPVEKPWFSRIALATAQDIRLRLGAILVGLWLINWIYPTDPPPLGHLLPTH